MGNCQKDGTVSENVMVKNVGPVCQLKISNVVWQNAYQGLFDYQSHNVQEKSIITKQNSVLRKDKNQLCVVSNKEDISDKKLLQSSLFHIMKKTNYYKIFPIFIQVQQYTLQKLLWLIVRTLPQQKYKIAERDIIKFGKQKIKIKQLVPVSMNNSFVLDFNQINVQSQIYDDLKYKQVYTKYEKSRQTTRVMKKQLLSSGVMMPYTGNNEVLSIVTANEASCRICLQPGLKSDPLIAPCKCAGSIRYIHLKCLRMWLGKRLNVSKHRCCITLNWQKLSCQMCHQLYNYRIYLDNRKFYTVEIPKPQKPYIVFQVMKKSSEKSSGKIYHFVSLAQKDSVSIGRKKDVDVRISDDISVSRHHASMSYDYTKNHFTLEDNKSKFGTLVLIKRNLCIKPNMKGVGFQIGTQVYQFQTTRGPVTQQSNSKDPVIEDNEQYINIEEQEDHQVIDDNQQNSDSQGRFEQKQQEQIEQLNRIISLPGLRISQTLIQQQDLL